MASSPAAPKDRPVVARGRALSNPIAQAIDKLVHRALDIQSAVSVFIPLAERTQKETLDRITALLKKSAADLSRKESGIDRIVILRNVHNAAFELMLAANSTLPKVLEGSLFLGLFSNFDAFIGDLVRGLFDLRPELFKSLNRTVEFSEILSASSMDSLKKKILEDEIETLRRKSYAEQFAHLGGRFGIKLTEFPGWANFIEASQRRNLITHCDGIVSDQYLASCVDVGLSAGALRSLGADVGLGTEYLVGTCELVVEVGIKLGQTLWRKTLPDQAADADEHIKFLLYSALHNRAWARGSMIGAFALNQKISSDLEKKMILINYAQALKRNGQGKTATELVERVDWSASTNEFRLAHAVLIEDYEQAAALMRRIGKRGEILKEEDYHTWPLFLEFRESNQFFSAYEAVYGYPYALKVEQDAVQVAQQSELGPGDDAASGPKIW